MTSGVLGEQGFASVSEQLAAMDCSPSILSDRFRGFTCGVSLPTASLGEWDGRINAYHIPPPELGRSSYRYTSKGVACYG